MGDLWTMFCGEAGCLDSWGCSSEFLFFNHPSSCVNHFLIVCFDVLLFFMFLFTMIQRTSAKTVHLPGRFQRFSSLQISSAIFTGCLGLVYLCLGVWILEENFRNIQIILPLHWWLLPLLQGFTWLLIGLMASLQGQYLPRSPLRLLCILAFLFSGVTGVLSIFSAIVNKEESVEIVLNVLSLPGAILLLLCTYKGYKYGETDKIINGSGLYTPLNGEPNGSAKTDSVRNVTHYAKAGFFSRMSFWWLNPLMKRGTEKTLESEDIPKLREQDRAENCYLQFLEELIKQKQIEPSSQPSILRVILICYWKDIFISGFFALLKILTLSAGPLLLNAFIDVAQGKELFKNEGYVLAIVLFVSKNLESLSQRQWYFRSRLIGLKVRSLLTAVIYKKQLRLSNAAKMIHSSGEITNYVTVDAYRIGEFPYWFHQTWTTSLQLCIVLAILFNILGLATFAALVVIILTVLCNTPLAKLQHKSQSKLMVAQDERLRACSEALVNMKVLKLYAWETHFKNVIEKLREVEYKWLSGVQLRRGYNGFLFSSSPVLVSAATFGACYFLRIPLNAGNVFTFVAALRLVQDPIRTIPDVIGVVIQAKVAFARIVKFLEAPELQTSNVRQKSNMANISHAISIKSANFSWDENLSKPTLRNISLEVRTGEKVAICGEVGSGKSTLLAAILGEIPDVQGTVSSSYYKYTIILNEII